MGGAADFAEAGGQAPGLEKDFGSDASPDRPYVEFTDFDREASSLRAVLVDVRLFFPGKIAYGTRTATQLHELIAFNETNSYRLSILHSAAPHFIWHRTDARLER